METQPLNPDFANGGTKEVPVSGRKFSSTTPHCQSPSMCTHCFSRPSCTILLMFPSFFLVRSSVTLTHCCCCLRRDAKAAPRTRHAQLLLTVPRRSWSDHATTRLVSHGRGGDSHFLTNSHAKPVLVNKELLRCCLLTSVVLRSPSGGLSRTSPFPWPGHQAHHGPCETIWTSSSIVKHPGSTFLSESHFSSIFIR